jgi:hypothetical protein
VHQHSLLQHRLDRHHQKHVQLQRFQQRDLNLFRLFLYFLCHQDHHYRYFFLLHHRLHQL